MLREPLSSSPKSVDRSGVAFRCPLSLTTFVIGSAGGWKSSSRSSAPVMRAIVPPRENRPAMRLGRGCRLRLKVPPGSERPLLRCPPRGRPGTRSDSRTRISRLRFASNRGGLGRAAVPNIRRRDASNASGGLRRRLGLARHCAGGAGKPARRQLHEARAVGDREGDHGASEGAADHRRPQRGHAPHAHAGIHGISRVREGDVGEGRLRRPLRDVQHARVARDGAGGAPAGLADQQVVHGRHRRRRQLAVGGHDRL